MSNGRFTKPLSINLDGRGLTIPTAKSKTITRGIKSARSDTNRQSLFRLRSIYNSNRETLNRSGRYSGGPQLRIAQIKLCTVVMSNGRFAKPLSINCDGRSLSIPTAKSKTITRGIRVRAATQTDSLSLPLTISQQFFQRDSKRSGRYSGGPRISG